MVAGPVEAGVRAAMSLDDWERRADDEFDVRFDEDLLLYLLDRFGWPLTGQNSVDKDELLLCELEAR